MSQVQRLALFLGAASTAPELSRPWRAVAARRVADLDPSVAIQVAAVVLRSDAALSAVDIGNLPRLAVVVRPGSGVDNIDTHALQRRGVALLRNNTASASAVAEWVVLAALSLARRATVGQFGLARGEHLKGQCIGRPLADLQIGVWGSGPVALASADALQPFVAGVSMSAWPGFYPAHRVLNADELVRSVDMHVIAVPNRPSTAGQFGAPWLNQVAEQRPFVICAGRLETLDVSAQLQALVRGETAGLALDPVEPRHLAALQTALRSSLNLFVTPHIGAQRQDARRALDDWIRHSLGEVENLNNG